jgi:hypothetical protein
VVPLLAHAEAPMTHRQATSGRCGGYARLTGVAQVGGFASGAELVWRDAAPGLGPLGARVEQLLVRAEGSVQQLRRLRRVRRLQRGDAMVCGCIRGFMPSSVEEWRMQNASGGCAPAHAAAVRRRRRVLHPARREAAGDAREHCGRRRHAHGV